MSVFHNYIVSDQTISDLFGDLNTATRLCWQPYKMNLHFNPRQKYQDYEQLQTQHLHFQCHIKLNSEPPKDKAAAG